MEPKRKQRLVVDVTGNGSKVHCWKEPYCIGTWNIRSMNQGKLEVVKQEKKCMTEDEVVGWHHQLYGYEFEQAPSVGARQ